MVLSPPLLFYELSVSVKENPDRKKKKMSNWFDVHFEMSIISKGKILKLSLTSKSDIFNVWT